MSDEEFLRGTTILIVEDDESAAHALARLLSEWGAEVSVALNAEAALHQIREGAPDVALIDIILPGISGDELMAIVATESPGTTMMIITGEPSLETALIAFEADVWHYLVKPVEPAKIREELEAILVRKKEKRIVEYMRRAASFLTDVPPNLGSVITVGHLTIDENAHTVVRNGRPIDLTSTEFEILSILARQVGSIVPTGELVQALRRQGSRQASASVVHKHIHHLRQKLEGRQIQTISGQGYRLGSARRNKKS